MSQNKIVFAKVFELNFKELGKQTLARNYLKLLSLRKFYLLLSETRCYFELLFRLFNNALDQVGVY